MQTSLYSILVPRFFLPHVLTVTHHDPLKVVRLNAVTHLQGRERQRLLGEEMLRSCRRCEDANSDARHMKKAIDDAWCC